MNLSRIFKHSVTTCTRAKLYVNQQDYSKLCCTIKNSTTWNNSYDNINLQMRLVSSVQTKKFEQEDGLIKKILKKVPFLNPTRTKLIAAGYLLYEAVADNINYVEFFDELELPDTFYSWFVITELHVWMLSVRVMAEGDDGRLLRNSLVEALWADVTQRVKKLGASNPASARLQITELSEQLQAALIAYDEGLQSDDTILAGALWRRFYQQQDVNPKCLDLLVKYTRKQIRLLDHISREDLLTNTNICWEPLRK